MLLIEALSRLVPYGEDLFVKHLKNRHQIQYRGRFDSCAAAKAAVQENTTSEYDIINKNKSGKVEEGREELDIWFENHDYPYLFWVNQLTQTNSALVDLGGSLGHFYYSTQKHVQYPDDFKWYIAELPEAVKLGTDIAKERNDERLAFVDSANMSELPAVPIFMTAGTIQYMEPDLVEMLESLKALPEHVIVHKLPATENESYWTLQNLQVCEVPYRVYARCEVLAGLRKLGYEVKAEWYYERDLEVPFHLDAKVDRYIGFYCQRVEG